MPDIKKLSIAVEKFRHEIKEAGFRLHELDGVNFFPEYNAQTGEAGPAMLMRIIPNA